MVAQQVSDSSIQQSTKYIGNEEAISSLAGHRVTARDVMNMISHTETSVNFTFAWQGWHNQAKCVLCSSHSACSFRISVLMVASPLISFDAVLVCEGRQSVHNKASKFCHAEVK